MRLRETEIDEVEKEVLAGREATLSFRPLEALTVGALLELACRAYEWNRVGADGGISLARSWASRYAPFDEAWSALNEKQSLDPPSLFAAPEFEMFLITSSDKSDEYVALDWLHHTERFARSLKNNGFSNRLANGLSAAYREMGDNVSEHSGPDEHHPAHALAAYRVGDRQMAFAVADVGRGVLASLRSKPEWAHLTESQEALRLAVEQRATRRRDHDEGNGFKQVLRAIADINGVLRFRSGDATLTLEGINEESRHVSSRSSPTTAGFQLSVTCALASGLPDLYI